MRPRKSGSEGRPWSDPESDPLADLADAARRAREGWMVGDVPPLPLTPSQESPTLEP